MKSSLLMSRSRVMSRNASEMRSVNCCGDRPARRADCSTFWPCSSVPVRNFTRRPSSRIKRASTSHAPVDQLVRFERPTGGTKGRLDDKLRQQLLAGAIGVFRLGAGQLVGKGMELAEVKARNLRKHAQN